nr:Ycf23 [Porphyrostromium boryanum]
MAIHPQLQEDIKRKQVVKIISGCLNNFDKRSIEDTIIAADQGGATYIDIAADPKIVSLARELTTLPLCISSIVPQHILKCIEEGVQIIEIGNFDAFYSQSMNFNLQDIKNISKQIRQHNPNITICTTLPYILSLKEQVELAQFLEFIGIDLIQTEGTINNSDINKRVNLRLNKANSTLLTTYNLSKLVKIPIIAASGISSRNAGSAVLYGATGVGVKTAIENEKNINNKIDLVKSIRVSMSESLSKSKTK